MNTPGKSANPAADPPAQPSSEDRRGSADSPPVAGPPSARRLVARTDRWRYPSWPEVCRAAERARCRRDRLHPPAVRIRVQPGPTAAARVWHHLLWRDGPGWLLSLLVHAAVLFGLGWWAVEVSSEPADDALYVIRIDPASEPPGPPLLAVEIAVSSPAAVQSNGPFSQPLSAPDPVVDAGARPPAISLASFAEFRSGPVGEALALFGSDGRGAAESDNGTAGSEFFGVRATGTRFVFVVDCSRSMGEGDKWQDATRELLAAVERLGPDQSFYVLFFAGEVQPMFSAAAPEPDLLVATSENVERFRQWVSTVQLGPYTRPARAVQIGLQLMPDALYLLSDGVFEDQTAAILRQKNFVRQDGRRVPRAIVHTIGLHSREGQPVLQRIAQENGGRFVFIPAGQLAQTDRRRR